APPAFGGPVGPRRVRGAARRGPPRRGADSLRRGRGAGPRARPGRPGGRGRRGARAGLSAVACARAVRAGTGRGVLLDGRPAGPRVAGPARPVDVARRPPCSTRRTRRRGRVDAGPPCWPAPPSGPV